MAGIPTDTTPSIPDQPGIPPINQGDQYPKEFTRGNPTRHPWATRGVKPVSRPREGRFIILRLPRSSNYFYLRETPKEFY